MLCGNKSIKLLWPSRK